MTTFDDSELCCDYVTLVFACVITCEKSVCPNVGVKMPPKHFVFNDISSAVLVPNVVPVNESDRAL